MGHREEAGSRRGAAQGQAVNKKELEEKVADLEKRLREIEAQPKHPQPPIVMPNPAPPPYLDWRYQPWCRLRLWGG